jgi:hypothetical protein
MNIYPGEFQFDVDVPSNVPDGDQPIAATYQWGQYAGRRVAHGAALERFRHQCAASGRAVQGHHSQLLIAAEIADNSFTFRGLAG